MSASGSYPPYCFWRKTGHIFSLMMDIQYTVYTHQTINHSLESNLTPWTWKSFPSPSGLTAVYRNLWHHRVWSQVQQSSSLTRPNHIQQQLEVTPDRTWKHSRVLKYSLKWGHNFQHGSKMLIDIKKNCTIEGKQSCKVQTNLKNKWRHRCTQIQHNQMNAFIKISLKACHCTL